MLEACTLPIDVCHRLQGSARPVLSANDVDIMLSLRMANFDPPRRIDAPQPSYKILSQVTTSATFITVPNVVYGTSVQKYKWVNSSEFLYLFIDFWLLAKDSEVRGKPL